MNKKQLTLVISSFFSCDSLKPEKSWAAYKNFKKLCNEDDESTLDYFFSVIETDNKNKLKLRNNMAENGYELTPSQLEQYVFILRLCVNEYIDNQHYSV